MTLKLAALVTWTLACLGLALVVAWWAVRGLCDCIRSYGTGARRCAWR